MQQSGLRNVEPRLDLQKAPSARLEAILEPPGSGRHLGGLARHPLYLGLQIDRQTKPPAWPSQGTQGQQAGATGSGFVQPRPMPRLTPCHDGAGEGNRTLDTQLGKLGTPELDQWDSYKTAHFRPQGHQSVRREEQNWGRRRLRAPPWSP
jgi:hypothetical protein